MPPAPRHNDKTQCAPLGDHLVVLDPEHGQAHLLNQSASWVWGLIDGSADAAAIAAVIARAASLDAAAVTADVETLFATFRERGLLDDGAAAADFGPSSTSLPVFRGVTTGLSRPALSEARSSSAFRALGFEFVIETNELALGQLLDEALADLRLGDGAALTGVPRFLLVDVVAGEGVGRFQAWEGERCLRHGDDSGVVIDHLLSELNICVIDRSPGRLLFHAGAVSMGEHCLLLPAESGCGKSTLTAALVHRRHGYLTDEAAAVDPATFVAEPYPKPLSLSAQSVAALGLDAAAMAALPPSSATGLKRHVPVAALGGSPSRRQPVAGLVFPQYVAGADAALEALEPPEGFVRLAPSTFASTWSVPDGLERVIALVCSVPLYALTFDDLGEAVTLLESQPW